MNKHRAQFLHRKFGLSLYDIGELLGVCPQQVRA